MASSIETAHYIVEFGWAWAEVCIVILVFIALIYVIVYVIVKAVKSIMNCIRKGL